MPIAPVSVIYNSEALGIEVEGCNVMVIELAVLLEIELPSVICGLAVPRLLTIAPVEMNPAEQLSTEVVTANEFEANMFVGLRATFPRTMVFAPAGRPEPLPTKTVITL